MPGFQMAGSADRASTAAVPEFSQGDLRIELLSLATSAPELAELEGHLSVDESGAARRFRFDRDRRRYVAARGKLRVLLARHLDLEPRSVRLVYGPHGKPALAPDLAGSGLRFNLSHSEELALCAVARGLEVGIDLERVQHLADLDELAAQFFAPGECASLNRLPAPLRREAFFRCWTRKEAYLKGLGDGLALPLDTFEVSLAPGEPARLLRVADRPGDVDSWSIRDVPVPTGYAAALAVKREGGVAPRPERGCE